MATRKSTSNPLALAVLALLCEAPMHPYQMASLMRERGKHETIKLNYGSLYTVIAALEREGLITPTETMREGRRPERTVYAVTDTGRSEFLGWLRELLQTPVKEYTQFAAALSFAALLPPAEVSALLTDRANLLQREVDRLRDNMDGAAQAGVARVFLVEIEYELTLREAELRWVRALTGAIADGTLDGMPEWLAFHAGRSAAAAEAAGLPSAPAAPADPPMTWDDEGLNKE